LERTAAQGDAAARTSLLAERLRLGELPRERVRLAAHLGDPAAREVLGGDAPTPDLHLPRWLAALGDKALGARALMAVAAGSLRTWEQTFPHGRQPRTLLTALEVAAESPGDRTRWEVAQAARVEVEEARDLVRLLTDTVADAAERGLPTLTQVERRAITTGRRRSWDRTLQRLGTDGATVLARVRAACRGPQGEGGLPLLISTAILDELEPVDLLLLASFLLDPYDLIDDWAPRAARLLQRATRREGAPAVRQTIADALIPRLLR
jgi:hypothetical protein